MTAARFARTLDVKGVQNLTIPKLIPPVSSLRFQKFGSRLESAVALATNLVSVDFNKHKLTRSIIVIGVTKGAHRHPNRIHLGFCDSHSSFLFRLYAPTIALNSLPRGLSGASQV
jgi:hypothetical protein